MQKNSKEIDNLIEKLRPKEDSEKSKPSSSLVITSITVAPAQIDKGQNITVTMNVKYTSPEDENEKEATLNNIKLKENGCNVKPSKLIFSGTGKATLISGAEPGFTTIPLGGTKSFTWKFRADSTGRISFRGNASGADPVSGSIIVANEVESETAEIVFAKSIPITIKPAEISEKKIIRTMVVVAICTLVLGGFIAFAIHPSISVGKKNTLYIWANLPSFQVKLDNKISGETTTKGLAIPVTTGKHLAEIWSGNTALAKGEIEIKETQEIAVLEGSTIKVIK